MFLEMFEYGFMRTAFLAGTAVALICGFLGLFVVLRKLSFLTDGIAHISLAGIAVALATRSSIIAWTFAVALAGALGIGQLRSRFRISGDAAIGILLPVGLSTGVIILSLAKVTSVDLTSYLFGSILAIGEADMVLIVILGFATLAAALYFHRQFFFLAYDEEGAKASGMDVRLFNNVFFIIIGIATVLALRVSGILLVSALMVIPASSALQFRQSFKRTALISCAFALLSVWAGITVSFYAGAPTGAAIALCSFALFLLSAVATRR